jgi:hypothetical protein
MDILSGIGLEQLRMWIWILAIGFAVGMGLWRRHQLALVGFASTLLFATLNAGAGIYVLKCLGDSRWTVGDPPMSAPELSNVPFAGQYLEPLESSLESITGRVNSFWEFSQALPVALDFFTRSGWALLVAIPLIVIVLVRSYRTASRRRKDLQNLNGTVAQLQSELAAIKLALPAESYLALPPENQEQPRQQRTRRKQ